MVSDDIKSVAIQALRNGQVLSGLANCHAKGVYSLTIRERVSDERGMLRVFWAGEECQLSPLATADDYTLMPHNHRQDLTLYRITGQPSNVSVEIEEGQHWGWEYRFGSALLNGLFTLDRIRRVRLSHAFRPIHDHGLRMRWDEVHTVVAHPGDCWLVAEGVRSKADYTLCYSLKDDKTLSSDGLYLPMSRQSINEQLRSIVCRMELAA